MKIKYLQMAIDSIDRANFLTDKGELEQAAIAAQAATAQALVAIAQELNAARQGAHCQNCGYTGQVEEFEK